MGFCWDCGRFNVHHERCKNNPLNMSANPTFQSQNTTTSSSPSSIQAKDVDDLELDPNDPTAPPLKKQRCIRTCLTVWVSILCALGTLSIILAIVFASQIRSTFNPRQYDLLQKSALACGIVGAALLVPGIIIAITWCSMYCQCCCCKKTWICKCCR